MTKKNIKTFSGGYRFRRFSSDVDTELRSIEIPPMIVIPLTQGFGASLKPSVQIGDTVTTGQIIARDDTSVSTPIHSSVTGRVKEIRRLNYFKREVSMVVIECTGDDHSYVPLKGCSEQWHKLSPEKIEELLYLSGVTALDREGIPTRYKSSVIAAHDVQNLIIHGVGSEPYNISLDVLLGGKKLYHFADGIRMLQKIMPQAVIHVALNSENKDIFERLHKLKTVNDRFIMYPVLPKYPQGYDELLTPTILGKPFPYGYGAATVGIVVLNIQAVIQAYEAVAFGKPLIERTLGLFGTGFRKAEHVTVKVGTPLESIVKGRALDTPMRYVLNSPLTGFELNDLTLPIGKSASQIIALPQNKERKLFAFMRPGIYTDSYSRSFLSSFLPAKKRFGTDLQGEKRPCIQCGYCVEVCPVRILPAHIDRLIHTGINESVMRYGIFKCIECNVCSYVCPSKIPLARHIKDAKTQLIEIGCDNYICVLPKSDLKGLENYKGVKSVR